MLSKSKFRRKARRIAVSEIMIPIILIIVLGFTTIIFLIKLLIVSESEEIFGREERIEIKWIINLGIVIVYGLADLLLAYLLYTGIKEKSYRKCHLWVTLQITVLCLFTVVVMKRCNTITSAVTMAGYHFFEFILLAVCIYIYKIHHITFVYGLLDALKIGYADEAMLKRAQHKMILKRQSQVAEDTVSDADIQVEIVPDPLLTSEQIITRETSL